MLSGWWFQPIWIILVSWDYYSQYMENKKMFQTTNQSSCNTLFHLFWSINKIQRSFGTNSTSYLYSFTTLAGQWYRRFVFRAKLKGPTLHQYRNWAGPTRKNESIFWKWLDTAGNRFQNMAITNEHGVCLPWMMSILVLESLSPVNQWLNDMYHPSRRPRHAGVLFS